MVPCRCLAQTQTHPDPERDPSITCIMMQEDLAADGVAAVHIVIGNYVSQNVNKTVGCTLQATVHFFLVYCWSG